MAFKNSKMGQKLEISTKACFANAELFFEDAITLYGKGSYGHALSLAILGGEEAAKALLLGFVSRGMRKADEIHKATYVHWKKHGIALSFDAFLTGLMLLIKRKMSEGKVLLDDKNNPANINEIFSEHEVEELLNKVTSLPLGKAKKKERDKHVGLYVDINNDGSVISSPSQVSSKDAENAIFDLFWLMLILMSFLGIKASRNYSESLKRILSYEEAFNSYMERKVGEIGKK